MSHPNHERFVDRLVGSTGAPFVVAHYFCHKGYDTFVERLRIAPSLAEAPVYADKGDVWISNDRARHLIQAKGLTYEFTGAADWPFDDVLVAKKDQVDRLPNARAYYFLSPDYRHACVVDVRATRSHWWLTDRKVSNIDNIMQTFYALPTHLCLFRDMI